MKKENFVTLIMSVAGGLIFAIGMCMVLIPEWNAFTPGVVVCAAGAVVLIAMAVIRRKMSGAPKIKLNAKAAGTVAFAVFATLLLGAGMCMCMVWDMMIPGMIAGVAGIVLLICLIPMVNGIKNT